MSGLVGSSRVASELGVTRSAVSNWLRREILPPRLRPRLVDGGHPVWPEARLPELLAWHQGRRARRPGTARRQVLEVSATGLLPGDIVVSLSALGALELSDVIVTVRRRKPEGNGQDILENTEKENVHEHPS